MVELCLQYHYSMYRVIRCVPCIRVARVYHNHIMFYYFICLYPLQTTVVLNIFNYHSYKLRPNRGEWETATTQVGIKMGKWEESFQNYETSYLNKGGTPFLHHPLLVHVKFVHA